MRRPLESQMAMSSGRVVIAPAVARRGVVVWGGVSRSDPALLGGAAAVVGQRGHVLDGLDGQARGLQGRDGAFAPRAGPLDLDLDLLDAVLRRGRRGGLGGALGGERRALAAALEP